MSFSKAKREGVKKYILVLLDKNDPDFIRKTVENNNISRQTVHRYLKELAADKSIKKNEKTGRYEISKTKYYYVLNNNDLQEDVVFDNLIYKHIEKLPDNVKKIWQYGFTEMLNNAIDHSESEEIICWVDLSCIFTEITIYEKGVGIFNKIKEHYKLDSIESAVIELFKGKLTTDSSRHSGEGIFFTSRMFDMFYIYSSGCFFKHDNHSDEINKLKSGIDEGTVVFMKLSNESNKTTKEVFDMFAPMDEGFVKTELKIENTINIKNTVDIGYPVSRSQAKRLCSRFDEFKEVILDFDNISDIGQGYAHQLFVVFKNQHPDVKIKVKNANAEVQKMINHVAKSN